MIVVGQNYLGADRLEILAGERFNCGGSANGHKSRRFYLAVESGKWFWCLKLRHVWIIGFLMAKEIDLVNITVLGTRLAETNLVLFELYLQVRWDLTNPRVENEQLLKEVEEGLKSGDLSHVKLLLELRLDGTRDRRLIYRHQNNPKRN